MVNGYGSGGKTVVCNAHNPWFESEVLKGYGSGGKTVAVKTGIRWFESQVPSF